MSSLEKALVQLKQGGTVILEDDATNQRFIAVKRALGTTADDVNLLTKISTGVVMVAVTAERAEKLQLSPMLRPGQTQATEWNILTSVEAREGVTTGISAADRARTVSLLGDDRPSHRSIVQPGHIFPILTHEGGVLAKHSLPEGACDLVKLATGSEAAVIIEMLTARGEKYTHNQIKELSNKYSIPHTTISALTRYRLETEPLVTCVAEANIPTKLAGEVRSYIFKSKIHGGEHLALVKGTVSADTPILARVQSEFTFADVFGANTPPTRKQLLSSLEMIGKAGDGILVYLRRPKSGYLKEQVLSWEESFSKKPAVMMEYGIGAQILRHLGAKKINLITSSSKSIIGLDSFGLEIVSQTVLQ